MRAGLTICREYSQTLNWWLSLETGEQAIYLADLEGRQRRDR